MTNFWDYNVWGGINLVAVLLLSLLAANLLKKSFRIFRVSLIPTSVLGGIMLLIIAAIWNAVTGNPLFDTAFFGGDGYAGLEIITYHALGLGFIATSMRSSDQKLTKKRTTEIFNTGVTTVSTYLIQAIVGLGITMIAAMVIDGFFSAAGILLPFGYGQGTGQAMNYGNIYEQDYGFVGGKSFGLTIAALGFLSASLGGVIHLNILRKKHGIASVTRGGAPLKLEDFQQENEISLNGSIDKLTIQIALIGLAYWLSYFLMIILGNLLPGMKSVIYGFNFLFGVLMAAVLKAAMKMLKKTGVMKREYVNNFMMNRLGGVFFDLMVVAGIAAIRLDVLKNNWGIILILGVVGLVITYFYVRLTCVTLFKEYQEEQFLAMYGMLTGTASTGVILLRELDPNFKTPVADNLVYQNFPAIVFGFPMMLLATLAPKKPTLTFIILVVFFIAMNVILFRSYIFKRKKAKV